MSSNSWDDSQPIYRQLRERVIRLIIDGIFKEGEAIPSVRQVATDYQINHLTVSKAYQELVDEGTLQKRRGLGMFVAEGARQQLLERERKQFVEAEIPALFERMACLGIEVELLLELLDEERRRK